MHLEHVSIDIVDVNESMVKCVLSVLESCRICLNLGISDVIIVLSVFV